MSSGKRKSMNFISFLRRRQTVPIKACKSRFASSLPTFKGRIRTLLKTSKRSKPPDNLRNLTNEKRSLRLLTIGVPRNRHFNPYSIEDEESC